MQPSNAEIKIVEKIKFWEEQEKINDVLVRRLLHLNKEMTILIAENEVYKKELNKIVTQITVLSNEITISKEISSHSTDKINEVKNTQGIGIRAVHISFILSLFAIIISTISLLS